MKAIASWGMIGVGILHTAVGLVVGAGTARMILLDGFIGAVETTPARSSWFWFMLTGFVLLVLGHLSLWIERHLLQPLPKFLGWELLLLGLLASLAIPISGGWLVAGLGMFILLFPKSRRLVRPGV